MALILRYVTSKPILFNEHFLLTLRRSQKLSGIPKEPRNPPIKESKEEEKPKTPGQRAFSAKERVVDWQMLQSKKGRSKIEPLVPTNTATSEPETVVESHLERSSIWKKRNRLPPSDVLMLLAEEQIAEAQQQGFFDNLKGVGKPLTPDDLSPPGKGDLTERLITRMVHNQGFIPEWVESEKEIANDIDALRKDLLNRFGSYLENSDSILDVVDNHVKERLLNHIEDINSRIDRLNLIVPMLRFQRAHVTLERELKRLKAKLDSQKKIHGPD